MEIAPTLREKLAFIAYWENVIYDPRAKFCFICRTPVIKSNAGITSETTTLCWDCFTKMRETYRKYESIRKHYERAIANTVYALVEKCGGMRTKESQAESFVMLSKIMRKYAAELKQNGINPDILFSGWWTSLTGIAIGKKSSKMSERKIIAVAQAISKTLHDADAAAMQALVLAS